MNKEEFKYGFITEEDYYQMYPNMKTGKGFVSELIQENKQLKERVEYLERSNNRRENEILSLRDEQELDKLKDEIKSYQDMYFDKVMTINKAIEHLNIKQIRFLNEKDYILNNEDLDEIMEILKGEE